MLPTDSFAQWLARTVAVQPRLSLDRGWPADLAAWREELRVEVVKRLGVDLEHRASYEEEVISEREMADHFRRYVRLHCADGLVIPAYLLLPRQADTQSPLPAVLALHGHGPGKVIPAGFTNDVKGRPVAIVGERDYAVQAAQRGYVALAPDQLGFGELMLEEDWAADRSSSCDQLALRCLLAGTTALGQRVRQAMICLDYLANLPQVDAGRLVVMGQSGGGTTSLFTGALDQRVWATVVSAYLCTFRHSLLAMHHCSCNYVPHLLEVAEMYDIAALIAPRLLYVISGREDPIFPRAGVEEAVARLRAVYQRLGREDHFAHYEGPEGHRFYAAEVWDWLAARL